MTFRAHAWMASLGLVLACGGELPPEGPTSPESYAVALASAYCDYGLRCESPRDAERLSEYCHPLALEQRLGGLLERQPHMAYDREAAARCLAAIATASASCGSFACDPVLVGTRPVGASCDAAGQCEPGAICEDAREPGRCSGTCARAPTEGERCRGGRGCAEGLRCTGGRCVRQGEVGDACEHRRECRRPLRCDRERGECYAPADAEGRPCGEDDLDDDADDEVDESDDDACPVPLECVAGRCARHEPGQVAGPGEACDPAPCAADHFCDEGVCAPNPRLTEPCDAGRPCMEGRCVSGTCQLLPPRAACERDAECSTDRCMGTCEVPSALGGRCERDRDCANGLECAGGRCELPGPCA